MSVFARMNRIQKALQITRSGEAEPVYSDVILKLVDYIGMQHMIPLSLVNVYWCVSFISLSNYISLICRHITIQRFSMLSQLEMNSFFEPDQPFPFYLHDWINEYTWQLARTAPPGRELWQKVHANKGVR